MDIRLKTTSGCLLLLALCAPARAQVPFFGGGSVAFDPEVGVIQSGALLDAQPVVSHDMKYVTLNMRPQASRLRGFQPFPVTAFANSGFVGGVNLPGGNAVRQNAPKDDARPRGNAPPVQPSAPSPDEIARSAKAWVFTRQGMYQIARLP